MKNIICSACILIFLFGFRRSATGQDTQVSNVRFEDRGETISVRYDLSGAYGKKFKIVISLSDDKGSTFTIKPQTVRGDIGKNVSPGRNKEILWQVKADFPYGLKGSDFVFAVDAEMQKSGGRWPYVVGAAVVGGVVYFATQGSKETKSSTTGSIVIDVPGSAP